MLTQKEIELIREIRGRGYAVVLITPDELKGASADHVEDRLIEISWDVIDALRTEKIDDEIDD